MRSLADITKSS